MREIGVNTHCECGDTLAEILQNIKTAGFRNIMLMENKGRLEKEIELIKAQGFNIPFVHMEYRDRGDNETSINVDKLWLKSESKALVKNIIERIKICAKHGIDTVVMHPVSRPHLKCNKPDWSMDLGVDSFKQIAAAAAKVGVKVALENLNASDNVYLHYLLERIPNIGFCYDCGHHYLYAPEVDFMGMYGNRCLAVHLHDNNMDAVEVDRYQPCDTDLHLLPFDGKIDFQKVLADIKASSYKGILMLELHKSAEPVTREKYGNLSPADYLKTAFSRGKKLLKIR